MNKEEREEFLNTPHIPDGVKEEHFQAMLEILDKIPPGWGKWISCDKGWYPLLVETHNRLKFIDPNYEIHQIKEKFGTLRFYYGSEFTFDTVERNIMDDIVHQAEYRSERICETCGEKSYLSKIKNRQVRYWYKTECIECAKERGYEEDIPEEEW